MRIAVNTRLLQKDKLEGIGWFSYHTLKQIVERHPEHEFLFLFDRPYDSQFVFANNVMPIVAGLPTRHPILWYLWFEQTVPSILKKMNADFFLSPDGFLSLRSSVKQLAVIHDLNFEYRPYDLPFSSRHYYRHFFPKYAHKATRIVTVSDYSKQDIMNRYGLPSEQIDVVYNGVDPVFKPASMALRQSTKQQYTHGVDYFVYVGSLHPRKNIDGLLQAFDRFRQSSPKAYKLVIVGEKMFGTSQIEQTYRNMAHHSDVVFTGRVSSKTMRLLIASSEALLLVSHFEGFGVPLLEAMHCEVPIVCSNQTALPEIAGSAAVLVDASSVNSIVNGILQIAGNKHIRRQLIEEARKQRIAFTWTRTSVMLWDSIERCI